MYYTNTVKITLTNSTIANKALDILRSRLSAGFAVDNNYRRNPSLRMSEALEVVDNTIVLPEDFGCYITEDAKSIMFELIQNLAENLGSDPFDWDGWDSNDYTDGHFEAACQNGLPRIKYTYYPSGASSVEYYSQCDEVVDPSEYLPITTEKIIHII